MFPYPGSPDYTRRWGQPDEVAWERAHAHYLSQFGAFSDIQDTRPLPLSPAGASSVPEPDVRRVLDDADVVGGVWTYALELARGPRRTRDRHDVSR